MDNVQSIQQNDSVVNNNGYLAQLQPQINMH